jgi:hypothetical protein
MDALGMVVAAVALILVFGALAVGFGADSRDNMDEGRLPVRGAF